MWIDKSRCGRHVHDHRSPYRISPRLPVQMIHNKRRIAYVTMNKRSINLAYLNNYLLWNSFVFFYLSAQEVIVPRDGSEMNATVYANVDWHIS